MRGLAISEGTKIDAASVNSSAPSKKGYFLSIPLDNYLLQCIPSFIYLWIFICHYATIQPFFGIFLRYFLSSYCGTFPFQRTLSYLRLRKFSQHQATSQITILGYSCYIF